MPKKENETVGARVLPNNLEAEQAVLCSAMTDTEAAINIVAKLKSEDFYSNAHKTIFDAVMELYQKDKPIDIISLADVLETKNMLSSVGGMKYLTTLSNAIPSTAYYMNWVDIVRKNSVLRQLISSAGRIIEKAYSSDEDDALGFAEKEIFEIAEKGQNSSLEMLANSLTDVMENFNEIHKSGGVVRGIPTGFYQLDRITNGLQKSDLIILAARPSVGKTSLAMNIVTNAAIEVNAKCAVFSLEMSKQQLAQRMLCSVANVDMTKALHGELNENDWSKLWKAHNKLSNCKIFVDDSSLNRPSQILSKCRKLKREKGIDLIMIDYLQLMTGDGKSDNRQTEVSEISRKMKILAKEINVPVILLSQMSRSVEKMGNRKPVLSDLRESGAIEQDADMVMFIHRPEEIQKEGAERPRDYQVQLIIEKHRNGELGTIPLGWVGSRVSFVNLDKDANAKSMEESLEGLTPPPLNEPDEPMEVGNIDELGDIFDE